MKVYDSGKRPVLLGERIGYGGEASVYRVENRPHWLAKIYEPAPRLNYDLKLAWMISHPPINPTHALNHPSLAWPEDLLYHPTQRLAGYLMPYIQVAVPILEVFNPKRRQAILPRFDRHYLHRVARNLAATLSALHRGGYVAGDLNESNIMVTPRALVTLIDTDSYQVEVKHDSSEIVFPCPVGKFEYTPPELQGQPLSQVRRSPQHDAFGLGVLIFQLLMEGNHPFRAQWLGEGEPPPIEKRIALGAFPYMASPPCPVQPPKNVPNLNLLHPSLVELMRRCFIDGHRNPSLRPSPAVWEKTIASAEEALVSCSEGHWYSDHLRTCPYCSTDQNSPPTQRYAPHPAKPISTLKRQQSAQSAQPIAAVMQPTTSPTGGRSPFSRLSMSGLAASSVHTPSTPSTPRSVYSPVKPFLWASRPALSQWPVWKTRVRSRMVQSLKYGGSSGALAGAALGTLASMGMASGLENWGLLWALGGMAAGMACGWKPGRSTGQWVNHHIGGGRFWQATGLLAGGILGILLNSLLGGSVFTLLTFPLAFAGLGAWAGRRLWLVGKQFNWDRIWAVIGSVGGALLGWSLVSWILKSGVSAYIYEIIVTLIARITASTPNWMIMGALAGALGGVIAGYTIDLLARLAGLFR